MPVDPSPGEESAFEPESTEFPSVPVETSICTSGPVDASVFGCPPAGLLLLEQP